MSVPAPPPRTGPYGCSSSTVATILLDFTNNQFKDKDALAIFKLMKEDQREIWTASDRAKDTARANNISAYLSAMNHWRSDFPNLRPTFEEATRAYRARPRREDWDLFASSDQLSFAEREKLKWKPEDYQRIRVVTKTNGMTDQQRQAVDSYNQATFDTFRQVWRSQFGVNPTPAQAKLAYKAQPSPADFQLPYETTEHPDDARRIGRHLFTRQDYDKYMRMPEHFRAARKPFRFF